MKIFVTGSTGFLGSHLVKKLLESGERDIRCLVRQLSRAERLKAIADNYPDARIEFFKGNLVSKEDAREAVKGVDIIYHCAASLKGAVADMFLNTVVASKNLLEAIVNDGINIKRIVLVSSFSVYGVADLPKNAVITENTPLEKNPVKRDAYSYTKLKQELLFWKYYKKYKIPLVVVRPGVIYGPGGVAISTRVGVNLFGIFLHLGNNNLLPLTYVENCADAIVRAGRIPDIEGEVFNIVDDDLPTSKEYLKMYKKHVKKIRSISIPYWVFYIFSMFIEKYHRYSRGQIPDIFTPYKSASFWKGQKFSNEKIKKNLRWSPAIPTHDALKRTFGNIKDAM